MGVALILYGVFAIVVLVSSTTSRMRPREKYIAISVATLNHLGRTREDLVVVDLRASGYAIISDALRVPAEELKGFLRWVPQRSTLVLCGWSEAALCRDKIEMSFLRLGIESVYVVDDAGDLLKLRVAPQRTGKRF